MSALSKTLFWDVDFNDLDYKKHADFIIKRVLLYGDKSDWELIKRKYGLDKIRDYLKNNTLQDSKSDNYWRLILELPPYDN
jgi:hypothetical protein